MDPAKDRVAVQFMVLGFVSVALNTLADVVVAFVASGIREGAAVRPVLIRRLREGSGGDDDCAGPRFDARRGRAHSRLPLPASLVADTCAFGAVVMAAVRLEGPASYSREENSFLMS